MSFVIQKGIPIPRQRPPTSAYQDVIDRLEIGDSFLVVTDKQSSVVVLAHKCALRSQKTVTTRRVVEDGQKGVRVWRTK